jgi:hypothetical protein
MATCLIQNRSDLFNDYVEAEKGYGINKLSDIYLIAKYAIGLSLSANELIALSKEVGFSNQRYIKTEKELFENELKKILIQKYANDDFPLAQYPIKNWPLRLETLMANYSIDSDKRFLKLPCLKEYKPFKEEACKLLEEIHENVKIIITKIRKNTKSISAKKFKLI